MILRYARTVGSVIGCLILISGEAWPKNVVLTQNFEEIDRNEIPVVGSESDLGGAWRDFGKGETSPLVTDQEFFKAEGATTGNSVRITRNDAQAGTTDFWLMGSWVAPLEFGKLRISFRVLRDSMDSGFSVHLGTAETFLGENTIAVAVGNRSSSMEKLQVMSADGTWETTDIPIHVGEWTQIALDVDFEAATYLVSIDEMPATEPIPFIKTGGLRKLSFLPMVPDGNYSFIDDIEIVEAD